MSIVKEPDRMAYHLESDFSVLLYKRARITRDDISNNGKYRAVPSDAVSADLDFSEKAMDVVCRQIESWF